MFAIQNGGLLAYWVYILIMTLIFLLFALPVVDTWADSDTKTIHYRTGIRGFTKTKSVSFEDVECITVSILGAQNQPPIYQASAVIKDRKIPPIHIGSKDKYPLIAKIAEEAAVYFDCPIEEDEKIKSLRNELGEPLV